MPKRRAPQDPKRLREGSCGVGPHGPTHDLQPQALRIGLTDTPSQMRIMEIIPRRTGFSAHAIAGT
jgi:hypothetical protein